ncbi:MAG TPA: nitroreductase family deazaflavin-dependent oxidoreductase [Iamia sp.]|jgi:deazaflavin-dependent oxidoreductase (nitroreductase family)|nr:nitroreductase family deazaflavin-dependent oxidoreductase [Iamia sp.]
MSASEFNEFNRQIIEDFRANEGQVGGGFAGAPILIVHSTGAKSGQERLSPLVFRADGDRWVIFGSKGGAPTHPDWFHNLVVNPEASIEVGTDTVPVTATVAEGDEHDRLWEAQKAAMPGFAEYEEKAGGRRIPVVILTRR